MEAYAGKSVSSEPMQTPEARLWSAVEQIKKVTSALGEVTDRLCGSHPTAGEKGASLHAAINGHFDSVDQAANELGGCIERIAHDLGRVQSRL